MNAKQTGEAKRAREFYALLEKGFCYTGPYPDYATAAAWIRGQNQPEKWSIVAKQPKGLPS